MIISDKHRLAFIHVPKCGGTTVRHSLSHLDDRAGLYSCVRVHPQLGRVDFKHLPLDVLRRHFADEFECVRMYRAFGLCREPVERFLSAVLQRSMMYENRRRETLSRREVTTEIERVLHYLAENNTITNYRFIHFERQRRFLYADDELVVDRVFRICDMDRMYQEIAAYTGIDIEPVAKKNEALYARNGAMRFLIGRLWPVCRRLLPDSVADLRHLVKGYVYVPARDRLSSLLGSSELRFIEQYYAEDANLFHSLDSRPGCRI